MEWVITSLQSMADQCEKIMLNANIKELDMSMEEVDVPNYERHLRIVIRCDSKEGTDEATSSIN